MKVFISASKVVKIPELKLLRRRGPYKITLHVVPDKPIPNEALEVDITDPAITEAIEDAKSYRLGMTVDGILESNKGYQYTLYGSLKNLNRFVYDLFPHDTSNQIDRLFDYARRIVKV